MPSTGVFPVHNNIFKIGTLGRSSGELDMKQIADMETFEVSIDGKTEEWTPMDLEGWIRRAVTGKGLTISLKGKRNYGNDGNDYCASKILATGQDVETVFEWNMPSGSKLSGNCVLDIKTFGGGDSTGIGALEVDILSDGKPTFTDNASCAALTFVCEDATTAGATKISTVVPALTGGNAYYVKINAGLPDLDEAISIANGWAAYTLGNDIMTSNGNTVTLVETNTGLAKKAGTAAAVVA